MTGLSPTAPRLSEFAELCRQLAGTSSKLQKRSWIAAYLRGRDLHDAALAALYLAGSPFAATDGRQLNVGGALLSRVLAERTGASREAMHAAYLRHGDLGGAAFDLLRDQAEERNTAAALTLAQVDAAFAAIAAESKAAVKGRLLSALLERATPLEAKYLIKIVLGDMRIGVKESLVEEAIAAAYDAPLGRVRRATMLNGSLAEVVKLAAGSRLHEAAMKLFHPLGFMLASPVDSVEEALQRFRQETRVEAGSQMDNSGIGNAVAETVAETVAAASMARAQVEDKYDGIRAQIHCGDPGQPGRVVLFSRSREDMTVSFPEIVEAFAAFPQPAILDGEILAWEPTMRGRRGAPGGPALNPVLNPARDVARNQDADGSQQPEETEGRALPFTALQPRLGRKRVTAEMRERTPVVFVAFDLLYAAGELLLERPLAERRKALEEMVARERRRTSVGSRDVSVGDQPRLPFESPPARNAFARLVLAPAVALEDTAQLEQAYGDARARGNEGIMMKSLRSVYQPGRRGLAWLKLKRELATLDVVVTAAEYGHGKRAGLLSDYTFAVRDGDKLRNVGKAYSGVTDAEIETLTRFFIEHTIEDFGFVRSVEPAIVLEVAFNNIMRSDRHDSGFALRFPRIVRIRNDKPVIEIDTLERVAEIYRSQESARSIENSAVNDSPG